MVNRPPMIAPDASVSSRRPSSSCSSGLRLRDAAPSWRATSQASAFCRMRGDRLSTAGEGEGLRS
eukprot:15054197-Heterocapsa_arctica.AAC.1